MTDAMRDAIAKEDTQGLCEALVDIADEILLRWMQVGGEVMTDDPVEGTDPVLPKVSF